MKAATSSEVFLTSKVFWKYLFESSSYLLYSNVPVLFLWVFIRLFLDREPEDGTPQPCENRIDIFYTYESYVSCVMTFTNFPPRSMNRARVKMPHL